MPRIAILATLLIFAEFARLGGPLPLGLEPPLPFALEHPLRPLVLLSGLRSGRFAKRFSSRRSNLLRISDSEVRSPCETERCFGWRFSWSRKDCIARFSTVSALRVESVPGGSYGLGSSDQPLKKWVPAKSVELSSLVELLAALRSSFIDMLTRELALVLRVTSALAGPSTTAPRRERRSRVPRVHSAHARARRLHRRASGWASAKADRRKNSMMSIGTLNGGGAGYWRM